MNNMYKVAGGLMFVLSMSGLYGTESALEPQAASVGANPMANSNDPIRTCHPEAQWFGEAGLGLFIHWGLASAAPEGKSDLSWGMMKDSSYQGDNTGVITPRDYFNLAEKFQPDRYDPDRWLAAAAKAGFRYAVMTTKHHDGYALWPSQVGQFNTRIYMQGRDLVAPFVEACRKNGLKVGFYYSPPDWYLERNYRSFRYHGRHPGRPPLGLDHEEIKITPPPPGFEDRVRAYIRAQIVELLTQYGRIDVMWFDGGPEVISIDEIRRLQPHIVINPHMHGKADFETSECKLPKSRPTGWWEVCLTWGRLGSWGYLKDEDYNSTDWALDWLCRIRAWGGNLLLNVGPRPNGELPDVVYERFAELESWMKHSGESVFGVKAGPWPESCNIPVTIRGATWYLQLPPEFQEVVELKKSESPVQVTLLRTGQKRDYTIANGVLRLQIPKLSRTKLVDVVKIEY
jgi:alpha-L-fucosidase